MFPVFADLSGCLCLVVGGGPVGRRKANKLLASGALVRLVCLEPRPTGDVNPCLEWICAAYGPDHLAGVCLAVAAATPEVNSRVVLDARAKGIWVNNATNPEEGNIVFPATLERLPLTLAVGTAGAAPALAAAVRDLLADQLDADFATWAALVAELRPLVRARVADEGRRRDLLRRFAQSEWLDRLRQSGPEATRTAMLAELGGCTS